MNTILVVDDEPDIRQLVREILEEEGYRVRTAATGEQARSLVRETEPNLILLDIWMPDVDGITLLREWSERLAARCPIVMMSGHGTIETAVEATRLSAYDFLEKPLSMAKLTLTVRHALEAVNLQRENLKLRHRGGQIDPFAGKSKLMHDLRDRLHRLAQHDMPVLIIGESGTDKEMYARYLHFHSERAGLPFVWAPAADTAGSADLRQWTGAVEDGNVRSGLLDRAQGGVLFLKDVARLNGEIQFLLKRLIGERSYEREGAEAPIPLDVRVVAATRSNLEKAVQESRFRDDLYFLLNVVPVSVPALRERREDIPQLLEYYVNFFVDQERLPYRHFTVAAQNRLRSYPWPGNVRELRNLVQRLLILGSSERIEEPEIQKALGERGPADDDVARSLFDLPLRRAREKFEKAYLEYQLKKLGNNLSQLAANIGIERSYLYRKMRSLGIRDAR